MSSLSAPSVFLLSVSISYVVLALIIAAARLFEVSFAQLSLVIWSYYLLALLMVAALAVRYVQRMSHNFSARNFRYDYWPVVLILLITGVYHLTAGAYTEIPADIYYHVEKFRQISNVFSAGNLTPVASFAEVVKQDVEVWYHLLAWASHVTGVSTGQMVQTATLLSQSLFLVAVYCFAWLLFRERKNADIIAFLAAILVGLHLGVSAFSYVRYYALAPAMLAFILYLSAMIVCWAMLKKPYAQQRLLGVFLKLVFLLLVLIGTVLIHTQEAMFIVIHVSVLTCFYALSLLFSSRQSLVNGPLAYRSEIWFNRCVLLLAVIIVAIFSAAYMYAHFNLVHFGNYGNRLLEFGPTVGVLPQWSILNPTYQFIQVVTLWGVLVYVLFFIHWRRYQKNLILVSGMLLPAVTVFNPFFTDLFLRLTDSTVLWRFCFLIPIHYVAADLLLLYLQRVFFGGGDVSLSVLQRSLIAVALSGLMVLLLPFQNGWRDMHYSRYPTLRGVAETQSYQHLSDVIHLLNQLPERHEILTDPVTGYVLSGFTPHINYRDKFFVTSYSGFKQFTFDDYTNAPLKQYAGDLLVINLRTPANGESFVGAVTRHWAADLFKRIDAFYPEQLLEHVQANPEAFVPLYEHEQLWVFKLQ